MLIYHLLLLLNRFEPVVALRCTAIGMVVLVLIRLNRVYQDLMLLYILLSAVILEISEKSRDKLWLVMLVIDHVNPLFLLFRWQRYLMNRWVKFPLIDRVHVAQDTLIHHALLSTLLCQLILRVWYLQRILLLEGVLVHRGENYRMRHFYVVNLQLWMKIGWFFLDRVVIRCVVRNIPCDCIYCHFPWLFIDIFVIRWISFPDAFVQLFQFTLRSDFILVVAEQGTAAKVSRDYSMVPSLLDYAVGVCAATTVPALCEIM